MNWSDRRVPASQGDLTLQQGLDSLAAVGARCRHRPVGSRASFRAPRDRLAPQSGICDTLA
jgi:hypothetical protein